MEKKIHICDICEHEIRDYSPTGNSFVDGFGANQIWPTKNGIKDVCSHCGYILSRAQFLGIINKIDIEPLYVVAGFVFDKDQSAWVRG